MKKCRSLYIGFFCFILIAIITVFTGCSLFQLNNNDSSDNDQSAELSKEKTYTYYNLGESFNYDNLEVTIKNYKFTYYAWQGDYYAGDNNIWVILTMSIYNNTSETKYLIENSWFSSTQKYAKSIIYKTESGEEAEYSGSYGAQSDFIANHEKILGYGTLTGICAFKLPVSVAKKVIDLNYYLRSTLVVPQNKGLYFEFCFNKYDETNIIRVKL